MNLKEIYTYLPNCDSFLQVNIEDHNINHILPDFCADDNSVICIYGISEDLMNKTICKCAQVAQLLNKEISDKMLSKEVWDIQIKPYFLFDTLETLILFYNFANQLNEEQFSEMIDEMQIEYNVPWESVTLLVGKTTLEIIKYYERRYLL